MINRNYSNYTLNRAICAVDGLGQQKHTYTPLETISVSIVKADEATLGNTPLYSKVSYVGFTKANTEIQKQDKLDNVFLVVDVVCGAGNKQFLMLEKCENEA